ncbi:hypothetical protein [Bacillus pseudomycoides]|uniref:hypothetical protein n=1 Tax=Bacillus pseudomycoides TaxID=64104 RepID=UPI001FB280B7|nr:hypothetical protein [Bacillus pseudomycoides]
MGIHNVHYISVGCESEEKVLQAHRKAKEEFGQGDADVSLVSVMQDCMFSIRCNNRDKRWSSVDEYMAARSNYLCYLIEAGIPFIENKEKIVCSF